MQYTRRGALLLGLALLATVITAVPAAFASGATADRVEGPFETVVPVADADNDFGVELMFAECAFVKRVERPDGSATETQACELTGPFFEFPGTVPDRPYRHMAGVCAWSSDYWGHITGNLVLAEGVRISVTPSGNVHITATYPAEPIPLSDCGFE